MGSLESCCGLQCRNQTHSCQPNPTGKALEQSTPCRLFPPALLFPAGVYYGLKSARTQKGRELQEQFTQVGAWGQSKVEEKGVQIWRDERNIQQVNTDIQNKATQ